MMIWCLVYISCIFLTGARDKNAYIRRDAHMWGIPIGDECTVHHIQRNTQARQRENKNNDEIKKKVTDFFLFLFLRTTSAPFRVEAASSLTA